MKFYKALNLLYKNPDCKITHPNWDADTFIAFFEEDTIDMAVGEKGYSDFDICDMNSDEFEVVRTVHLKVDDEI